MFKEHEIIIKLQNHPVGLPFSFSPCTEFLSEIRLI